MPVSGHVCISLCRHPGMQSKHIKDHLSKNTNILCMAVAYRGRVRGSGGWVGVDVGRSSYIVSGSENSSGID